MQLTDTQHRILVALCRPARAGNGFAPPATNQEIADEVFLSVDAVKAHLRTLYRKFGIEELPHNQKRARLVELVVEGGYLDDDGEGAPTGARPAATSGAPMGAPRSTASAGPGRDRRRAWQLAAAAAAIAVVVLAVLALAGAFDGSSGAESTGVAAYRDAVRGYCRLALSGGERPPRRRSRGSGPRSYLEVIETVRGRVDSLPPPAGARPLPGALSRRPHQRRQLHQRDRRRPAGRRARAPRPTSSPS